VRTKSPRDNQRTVLIVDDNAAIRHLMAKAFLADGFTDYAEAENGKAGIEVAKQFHPDVITLDLSMPIMNGLEAATRLRKLFPETPIILFTLYGDNLLKSDATRFGIDAVLLKTAPLSSVIAKALQLLGP
jgi:two-component system, chemotaxis family, chemotaxis protein CheY